MPERGPYNIDQEVQPGEALSEGDVLAEAAKLIERIEAVIVKKDEKEKEEWRGRLEELKARRAFLEGLMDQDEEAMAKAEPREAIENKELSNAKLLLKQTTEEIEGLLEGNLEKSGDE